MKKIVFPPTRRARAGFVRNEFHLVRDLSTKGKSRWFVTDNFHNKIGTVEAVAVKKGPAQFKGCLIRHKDGKVPVRETPFITRSQARNAVATAWLFGLDEAEKFPITPGRDLLDAIAGSIAEGV